MVMRHSKIDPRSRMHEVMIAPQPYRRAAERLRLDASVATATSIRRAVTPQSSRVVQLTHRGKIGEPIAIDYFPAAGQNSVAASLNQIHNYPNNLSTLTSSKNPVLQYSSSQVPSSSSATSSSATSSRQSSFAGGGNANNNIIYSPHQQRSVTPTFSRRGNIYNNNNTVTFGDKTNIQMSPRSGGWINNNENSLMMLTGTVRDGKENTTKKPCEILGGIRESEHWVYALRNDAVQFKNKKPPPGFRGKGKPRVLPEKTGSDAGDDAAAKDGKKENEEKL